MRTGPISLAFTGRNVKVERPCTTARCPGIALSNMHAPLIFPRAKRDGMVKP